MIVTIDLEFEPGQIVYLKTDEDQQPRLVVGFYWVYGQLRYELMCGVTRSPHYADEITVDKNFVLTL